MCMADLGSFKPGEARGHQKARDAAPNWTCTKNHRMTSVEKYVVDSNANLDLIRFYIVFLQYKAITKKCERATSSSGLIDGWEFSAWEFSCEILKVKPPFPREANQESCHMKQRESIWIIGGGKKTSHKKSFILPAVSDIDNKLLFDQLRGSSNWRKPQLRGNMLYHWSDRKLYQVGAKLTI